MYSAVLGVFVPSGGSKWVIEAPYVMAAAHELKVHLGWVVAAYDLGEALANLLQPFWMLPILGMFGLRARDVMGYTFIVFLVLTPVVLVLVTLLGLTLRTRSEASMPMTRPDYGNGRMVAPGGTIFSRRWVLSRQGHGGPAGVDSPRRVQVNSKGKGKRLDL